MPAAKPPKKATEAPKAKKNREGASEAWNILASLRRPFSDRDTKWVTRRKVRNREEEPPVPEAYSGTSLRHKSFELDFMVRQIVSLLSENREQYIVYAPNETEEMNRLSDDAQKAISALMELLEDFHPIERPRALVHDYQVADGLAIEKISFNWDFFKKVIDTKGKEEDWSSAFEKYIREKRELPIRRSVVDPLTAYWEFDVDGLVAVAEYGKARRSALADTYKGEQSIHNALARIPISDNTTDESGATSGAIGMGSTYRDTGDLVTVVEIWTRTEFMLLAEGDGDEREVLVRQKHPFGRPPYFFAPGILTGSENPLHKFQPLVGPMYQTTLELSAVRTARFNAAYLSSFKPFYIKYDGGGAEMDEESGGLKIHFLMPGNDIPSIKGGEIVPIDWTNLDELQNMEMSLMGDRDRFGFQAVLAGSAASGDSTAWAMRMLRDQGMVQFNGVLRHFAQMREEEIRFIFNLVENVLKMDLPISRRVFDKETGRGTQKVLKITKKMCETGFDFQVRLSAGKASDRIAIVEEFRRAHEAGEVPMRTVLEEGWGFQNVGEIMDEVVDEQVRQELLPRAIELIVQIGASGALDDLKKLLPEEAPPSPAEVQAQVDAQAAEQEALMQQQAAMGGVVQPPPGGAIDPGSPPGGEIPAGVVEPGMGQGLIPQELPPDDPSIIMGQ